MLTDEQVKAQYYASQGLNAVDDVGKAYWLKRAKSKVTKKSGLYKLKVKQLKAIANK